MRDRYSASAPNFQDWRAGSRTLAAAAAYTFASRNLGTSDGAEPTRLRVVRGTPELFAVLGARPQVGRVFRPGRDDGAVVLSDRLWRSRFGADASVLGTTVRLDSEPFTVGGAMPPGFDFPVATEHTDAWVPMVLEAPGENTDRTSYWLSVVARLKHGATLDAARADLDAVTARIRAEHPELGASFGALVEPLSEGAVRNVRPALLLLSGAVALVLLARAEGRRRETAIRAALGATRGRLVRRGASSRRRRRARARGGRGAARQGPSATTCRSRSGFRRDGRARPARPSAARSPPTRRTCRWSTRPAARPSCSSAEPDPLGR